MSAVIVAPTDGVADDATAAPARGRLLRVLALALCAVWLVATLSGHDVRAGSCAGETLQMAEATLPLLDGAG